jgi:siroheme synthase-like protein
MLPAMLDLNGKKVVVIGAGRVAAKKITLLLDAGALVTVITKEAVVQVPLVVEDLILRPYRTGDLSGAFLVVDATGDQEVGDLIVREAREERVWLNVVDDAARSSFFFTAVLRDGDVVVAVSTEGASPALAQWIRNAVAVILPKNISEVARRLRQERSSLHERGDSTENLPWATRIEELLAETSNDLD